MHFRVLLLAILSFASDCFAFTAPCINRNFNERFGDLVKPVAIISHPDRRVDVQWAREKKISVNQVQKRYAATGILRCPSKELSANLVLVNDLIVTSSHIFTDPKTCKKISDPKHCNFIVKTKDKEQKIPLGEILSSGFRCPSTANMPSDDWAVVRLSKMVKGVTPYAVDANQSIESMQRVTSVSAINMDLYENGNKLSDYTKTMGECFSHKVYTVGGEAALFSSDCDGSQGQSGGAILNDDLEKAPILLGMHRGLSETDDQLKMAIQNGKANQDEFVEKDWANYHVALRGKFLSAVLNSVK